MSTARVSFENRKGQRLAALLDRPVDDEPIAYALFAHCFTCSKDYKAVSWVSRALAGQGVAVLRFDFTGLGESEGEFASTTFSSNVDDLVAAAEFMSRELAPPSLLIGHSMVADEPLAAGGTNTGPTPYELLSAALGACTTMTLRMYADRKQWPLEAVEARVRHRKVHCEDCGDPGAATSRIDHFSRELRLEGPLDDEQRRRLIEIADRCPVHRTLHSEVRITTALIP